MIQPGALLQDRYRVLKRLGQGGFGQTFVVDDGGTRKVLKILKLERFSNSEWKQKAVSLFQREAQVLSRLEHPGIPKVEPDGYFTLTDETGETLHCLLMEKIDGLNLKQWLEKRGNKPITQEQSLSWLKQLAEILDQLHQQELVHRDLKPANIMLRPNGQLALIDFGAVREVTQTYLVKKNDNVTGTVIISAGYTPPEQAEGKAVPQSDFFALGRTFVYLLTGKSPTDFDKDPRTGKLNWRECAPQVSKDLADLIDYLMAPFPGRRPQTPKIILRCLEETSSPIPLMPSVTPTRENRREALAKLDAVQLSSRGSPAQVDSPSTPKFSWTPKPIMDLIAGVLPSLAPPSPWQKAQLRRTLFGHSDTVKSIAISPDGQTLVSGSYDKTIKLWDLGTGKLLHTLTEHTQRVTCIAISPDGQILATGSYDRTIKLWALGTGELLGTLTGHLQRIRHIAFSPNGQTLISIALQIKLWAVRTGKLLRTLTGHSDSARLATFSPDGQTCVIGSLDGMIELWNPHNGKRTRTFPSPGGITTSGITSLAFSPDGQTLASGSSMVIQLWNPHTGQRLRNFSSESGGISSNGTTSVAFSPDGQTLASGCGTTIQLWDLQSGKRLCILSGHSKSVESIAFSPDRNILVSGSSDQTIKIWQPG
jgi:serine/threonine protein kinase